MTRQKTSGKPTIATSTSSDGLDRAYGTHRPTSRRWAGGVAGGAPPGPADVGGSCPDTVLRIPRRRRRGVVGTSPTALISVVSLLPGHRRAQDPFSTLSIWLSYVVAAALALCCPEKIAPRRSS